MTCLISHMCQDAPEFRLSAVNLVLVEGLFVRKAAESLGRWWRRSRRKVGWGPPLLRLLGAHHSFWATETTPEQTFAVVGCNTAHQPHRTHDWFRTCIAKRWLEIQLRRMPCIGPQRRRAHECTIRKSLNKWILVVFSHD